jgi:hypothetical protein
MTTTLQHLNRANVELLLIYEILSVEDAETIDRVMTHDEASGLQKIISVCLKQMEKLTA